MIIEVKDPERIVKEMFWLAWKACGGTTGNGFMRDNPTATKDDVWVNVVESGDYALSRNKPNNLTADYVFGRMMKLTLKYDANSITIPDSSCHPDYQAWSRKYPTYMALYNAANN